MEENKYAFEGVVAEAPEFKFLPSGVQVTVLKVTEIKSWNNKPSTVPFDFYGKPADWLSEKELKKGMQVRVHFELREVKGWAKLGAGKVDVLYGAQADHKPPTSQGSPPPPQSDDDIPF